MSALAGSLGSNFEFPENLITKSVEFIIIAFKTFDKFINWEVNMSTQNSESYLFHDF